MPEDDDLKTLIEKLKREKDEEIAEIVSKIKLRSLKQEILSQIQDLSYIVGLKAFFPRVFRGNKDYGILKYFGDIDLNPRQKYYDIDLPIRQKFLSSRDLDNISIIFRSGLEFLEVAENSTLFIKPILLYYGINQIYTGFIELLFKKLPKWQSHGVGIQVTPINKKELRWGVVICPKGFFKLLDITLEYLINDETPFSRFYYVQDQIPKIAQNNINYCKIIGKTQGREDPIVDLSDLISNTNKYFHVDYNSDRVNRILIDFLALFTFNSLLRYEPEYWSLHIKGDQVMFQNMIKIFERIFQNIRFFIELMEMDTPVNILRDWS